MGMIRSKYSEAFRALSKKAIFSSPEGREAGIPSRMLAYFCQKGQIEKVSRGMYKIKDIDFHSACGMAIQNSLMISSVSP